MRRERVAVVSPREECRSSARVWAPLLSGRADVSTCADPADVPDDAGLVVFDEQCADLDSWLALAGATGRAPDSIVVFDTSGRSRRGAVPWGTEGEEVLAAISDLLERRALIEDSDDFLESLRASNARLDEQRRRFARLAVEQADALRGANVSLSRELDRLTRVQSIARFFAAPGPEDTFAARLCEVVARALGASGTALVVTPEGTVDRSFKVSERNVRHVVAQVSDPSRTAAGLETTRKGQVAWWVPVGRTGALVVLARDDGSDGVDAETIDAARELLTEALETRLEARQGRERLDLTERVFRDLRGGLLRVDGGGRVALANPAFASLLGVSPSSLEGRPLTEVFVHDPHVLELLSAATGEETETWLTRPGGRRVAVSLRASRSDDEGAGLLVLLSDLSRRKEIEAEVRRADRLSSLGRLSAGVAHEIRNPLAGIRTTAELLRERLQDRPELEKFVDVILEESTRLDRIVGSLLQFAKPAAPRREPCPLEDLLNRVTRLAAGRAAERGVTLRVEVPDQVPSPLADRDQILQVLLNLALNAIDASPEGDTVRLGAERAEGHEVRLFVEDRGLGVPDGLADRVFDPFFTTKPGGTGLGLSISQNIVSQHEGRLQFVRE
ncbi:MAG: PAS domain-containing protein, partial [Gemmatimonadetes bacterium]|nr:PAS domain-containing protein [Gemmatimonadota bacterium]